MTNREAPTVIAWVKHEQGANCTRTANDIDPSWPSYVLEAELADAGTCQDCDVDFDDPLHGAAIGRCRSLRGEHLLVNCGCPEYARAI